MTLKNPGFPGLGSNRTFICKRIVPVIPDNDMIQDGNIQQNAAIPDLFGDFVVGFAWLEVARRMVVAQDDARCMLGKANLEDLLRIDDGPRDTPFGYPDLLDNPVCLVQKQDPKLLMREIADQSFENLKGIAAPGDFIFEDHFRFIAPAGQGKHGADLHRPFLADALDHLKIRHVYLP